MSERQHTEGQESGFEWKDFRLVLATQKAVDEIKKIKPPKTDKELRAKVKKVAIAVAGALHTAPAVALSAYIDPRVWEEWRSATRPSGKSPTWPTVVAKATKIEDRLAEHFRARWKAVDSDFANGVDVAKARAQFFLAQWVIFLTEVNCASGYFDPFRELLGVKDLWKLPDSRYVRELGTLKVVDHECGIVLAQHPQGRGRKPIQVAKEILRAIASKPPTLGKRMLDDVVDNLAERALDSFVEHMIADERNPSAAPSAPGPEKKAERPSTTQAQIEAQAISPKPKAHGEP
jgi:hypothetical protein